MNSTDLFDFLEEIPDGPDSEAGDVSEDEISEEPLMDNSLVPKINEFDIESMPIIFDDGNPLAAFSDDHSGEWSSEDEYPLSVIRTQELAKNILFGLNLLLTASKI